MTDYDDLFAEVQDVSGGVPTSNAVPALQQPTESYDDLFAEVTEIAPSTVNTSPVVESPGTDLVPQGPTPVAGEVSLADELGAMLGQVTPNIPQTDVELTVVDEPQEVSAWESFKRSTGTTEKMAAGFVDLVSTKFNLDNNPLTAGVMAMAVDQFVPGVDFKEAAIGLRRTGQKVHEASESMRRHAEKRIASYEAPVPLQREGESFWDVLADGERSWDFIVQTVMENSAPTVAIGIASAIGGPQVGFSGAVTIEGGANYDELRQMGVPAGDAADTAQIVGVINGFLEYLPWDTALKNVPGIRKKFTQAASDLTVNNPQLRKQLWQVLKIAGMEGATEAMQEFVGNVGKKVYNENQGLMEGMDEAAFLGFLMGGKMAAVTETVAETVYWAQKAEKAFYTEQTELSLASADQEVQAAMSAYELQQEKLEEAATSALDGKNPTLRVPINTYEKVPAERIESRNVAPSQRLYDAVQVQDSKGNYVPIKEMKPEDRAGKALKGGYGNALKLRLKEVENELEALLEQAEMGTPVQAEFAAAKAKQERLSKQAVELPGIVHGITRTVENYLKQTLPEYTVVVSDGVTQDIRVPGSVATGAVNFMDMPRKIAYMDLNVLDGVVTQPDGSVNFSALLPLINHEYGHVLAHHRFERAPMKVQDALYAEYNAWREVAETTPLKNLGPVVNAPGLQMVGATSIVGNEELTLRQLTSSPTNVKAQNYLLSFDEWLAQEMARTKAKRPRGAAKMFNGVRKALHRFFRMHPDAFAPSATFEEWVQTLGAKVKLEQAVTKLDQINPMNVKPGDETLLQEDQAEVDKQHWEDVWGGAATSIPTDKWTQGSNVMSKEKVKELDGYRTDFSRFKKWMLTLEQAAHRNQHIDGLMDFTQLASDFQSTIREYENKVEARLKAWRELGPTQGAALNDFSLEANRLSHKLKRTLTTPELVTLAGRMPQTLTQETFDMYADMQLEFQGNLDLVHATLVEQAERTIDESTAEGEAALQQRLELLAKQFRAAKGRNYFPESRFGDYTVTVRAKGDQVFEETAFVNEETVVFETFETEAEATKRQAQLRRQFKRTEYSVNSGILNKHERDYVGLPTPLLKAMRELVPEEKRADLEKAIVRSKPGQGFAKRFTGFKGTKGASRDGARGYATYTSSLGRHLSKIKYADQMDNAITRVQNSIRNLEVNDIDTAKRRHLVDMMQHQRDYIINPKFEWQWLSALSFNFYLAGVPFKVVLNMLQLPTVVFPYMSHRYGSRATVGAMDRAQNMMHKMRKNPESIPAHYHEAMRRLQEEGVTSQSMFYEIAGVEAGGPFSQILPNTGVFNKQAARNGMRRLSVVGGYLWNATENWARETTALAVYDLEIRNGSNPQDAYQASRTAVKQSMFEYARWNRPKFMQGNLRPFTIFYTHIQHMMEHIFGPHPEKYRTLAMLLLIGGVQGLPMVEDGEELLTGFFRFINRKYGREIFPHDSRLALREQLHELMTEITDDPMSLWTDAILRGGSRYSFGLAEAGKFAHSTGVNWGLPMPDTLKHLPHFDLHSSVSLGKIIPGMSAINVPDFNSFATRTTTEMAGAGFGIPLNIAKAYYDTSASDLSRLRTISPAFMSHPMKAAEYMYTQEASDPKGNQLVRFDMENNTHIAELMTQSLGANITRVNVAKEANWAWKSSRMYYQRRRSEYYRLFADAVEEGDKAGMEDIRRRVVRWNKDVPRWAKIRTKDFRSSVANQLDARKRAEVGLPAGGPKDILAKREYDQLFPQGE